MGFLSQLVGAVVDAVETATGNKHSEAGDVVEQQAAAAEQAASDAADAAAEAAAEAAGFVAAVVEQTKDTVTDTVVGGLNDAGIAVPTRLDLEGTVNLVVAIGDVTARNAIGKLERITGPTPVRVGKAVVSALVREGPDGVFDVVKGIVTETVDADGQIRNWMRQVGKVATETSPVEAVEEMLRRTPGGTVPVWEVLEGLLGGRQTSRKPKPIPKLTLRAEEERRKFIAELRWAVTRLERTQPKDPKAPGRIPVRGFSITPDRIELQRLIQVVLGARRGTPTPPDPIVSRHLAAALVAAVHSAVLHAQLQLWLSMVARLARVRQVARGPSRQQPASPSLGGVRLAHTTGSRGS
jgi:hypothetical protein